MNFAIDMTAILLVLFVCIITDKTLSMGVHERRTSDKSELISPDLLKQLLLIKHPVPRTMDESNVPPLSNQRRSESAERYFKWANKAQRPVEYFRGKRFWLFTKKDGNGNGNAEFMSNTPHHHNSLTQGFWRSGIVGRRRRR